MGRHFKSHIQSTCRKIVLMVLMAVAGICVSLGGIAVAQVDRQLPDFYTRPTVSPYVDLLRRNDRRDNLRYQRNVLPELRNLEFQRQDQERQRLLQDEIDRGFRQQDDATQRRLEELRRQAEEEKGPLPDLRFHSPFYQPASNPLTGASLRIRPTGHATTFGSGGRSAPGRSYSGGQAGLLYAPPAPNFLNSRSLNRARSLANRYR